MLWCLSAPFISPIESNERVHVQTRNLDALYQLLSYLVSLSSHGMEVSLLKDVHLFQVNKSDKRSDFHLVQETEQQGLGK